MGQGSRGRKWWGEEEGAHRGHPERGWLGCVCKTGLHSMKESKETWGVRVGSGRGW